MTKLLKRVGIRRVITSQLGRYRNEVSLFIDICLSTIEAVSLATKGSGCIPYRIAVAVVTAVFSMAVVFRVHGRDAVRLSP